MKTHTTTGAGNSAAQITTRYTNAGKMPDETQFDYVIEVSAWADAGTAEYIGISGHPTHDDLRAMLADEVAELWRWLDEEVKKGNMDERTDEPQVAEVRQRPASADGDCPPSHEWPVVIDNN